MDKNEDKKPWDDSFSDNRNQDGNLSRIELRKQKGNFKLILAVLISIVALIAIFSLAFGMSKQSSIQNGQPSTKKTTKKTTKPKKTAAKHQSDTTKKSKTTSDDNSQTADSSTSKTDDSNQTASSDDAKQSSTTKSSSDDAEYTTVNQSEGIYRVAKNAGISVSQLQALNGLNDNSVIAPGQKLRIK